MRIRCCLVALVLCSPAAAQDMPLSTILKEGEGWKPSPADSPAVSPVTSRSGRTYASRPDAQAVAIAQPGGVETVQKVPLGRPGALVLWPDGGTLVVADNAGRHLWAFRVEPDGSLSSGDRYYPLRVRAVRERTGRKAKQSNPDDGRIEMTALLVDGASRLYAATDIGIQIFDPTGRLCGVITNPAAGKVTALAFTGPDRDELTAVVDGKTYVRKMLAKGVGPKEARQEK